MKEKKRKALSELGLLVTAIIWGSGFVASSISLEYYTPYQVLFGRFLIGSLILSLVFMKRMKRIRKSTLGKGVVLGIFLYGAFALQTIGLQFTTPSKNAFLTAVNVIIVPFISFVLYKRRFDRFEVMGAILAMMGVGAISLQLSGAANLGDILTLGCAVLFAFQIFYTSLFVEHEDPVLLTLIQMATATFLGLILLLFQGQVAIPMEREALLSLFYLGIFSTTLAFLIQTVAQKYTTETKTAIILSTEAFWGMVLSVIILHEVMTPRMVIGGILIFLAIITSETKLKFLRLKGNREIQKPEIEEDIQ